MRILLYTIVLSRIPAAWQPVITFNLWILYNERRRPAAFLLTLLESSTATCKSTEAAVIAVVCRADTDRCVAHTKSSRCN